jgi:hypothetical protein
MDQLLLIKLRSRNTSYISIIGCLPNNLAGGQSLAFDSIDEEKATWLEKPFEESEVIEVLRGINSDKVLGPDGFTMAFFQACWDVIKDVMRVFHDFHARSKFEKSFNATFIALIPNISNFFIYK